MPRLGFRITLFLSSYAPLFVLLAYTNRDDATTWRVLVSVTVLGVVALAWVLFVLGKEAGPVLRVKHVRPNDGDVLAYTATYLLPFIGVDLSTADGVVVFVGFLLVLGVVYVNSNMILVNPLLSVARFHTFTVTDNDGHEYSLITRGGDIGPGDELRPAQISRYLRLEVRR